MPALTLTGGYSVSLTGVGAYTYTLPASAGTLVLTTDVSTAVAAETTRAQAAEATLTTSIGTVSTAVSTETSRAEAAEALLAPKTSATLTSPTITGPTVSNGTFTTPTITGLHETSLAMPANNIDCNAATVFTKTISGNTTFTVSNVPSSGTAASFILELTNGGSATVTWWSNVKWAGGAAPTLTTSGVDVLGFYTINGGSTWRGLLLGKAMA